MHQALYRKWRPRDFDEVSGQDHITSILKYQCATGKFSHAYLFCGSRGTGKTSCAKILAKAVNCAHPTPAGPCGECAACRSIDMGSATDVLEMDAASNNGVDDIRDIRDEVIYSPSELKYRVYIIDEVHMLSTSAFNALLKTLEEPPAHVVFILATTELQKLPATIISRCQRFDFRRISTADLCGRLRHIAREEGIELQEEAARLIARQAQGGMRDAVSLLELCAGSRLPVTAELVTRTVGTAGREGTARAVAAIADKNFDLLFDLVDDMVSASRDPAVFWQELIGYYRDMLVTKTTKDPSKYLDLTDSERSDLLTLSARFTKETMLFHIGLLEDALFAMQKSYSVKRTVAEITLVRLCDPALDTSLEAVLSRLSRVEEQLLTGSFAQPVQQTAPVRRTAPQGSPVADMAMQAGFAMDEPPMDEPPMDEPPMDEPPMELWEPPVEMPPMMEAPPMMDVPPVASASVRQAPTRQTSGPQARPTPVRTAPKAQSELPSPAPRRSAPDPTPPQKPAGQRVLRPIKTWTEAVDRVRDTSRMAASFLVSAKAFTTEEGQVVVKLESDFVRAMVSREGAPEALRAALSVCLRRKLEERDILYEVEETTGGETSLIDLIVEAAEEN